MIEFKLPAIGEGVVEGEIVRWLKQPGDPVAANEALVEVMTDKATVEIPSPQDAVVQEIRADEGVIAAVGEVIALFAESAAAANPTPTAAVAPSPPAPAPQPLRNSSPPPTHATPQPVSSNEPPPTQVGNGEILATPAARAFAREAGIDLSQVATPSGRITKADLIGFEAPPAPSPLVQQPTPSPAQPSVPAGTSPAARPPAAAPTQARVGTSEAPDEIPFRGMRRRIAEGLTKSFFTAVHYTYVEQVNVTRLVALRKEAKKAAEQEGISLTYLPFIAKAVIRGLKKFPMVNAELDEQAGRIILKKHYSLGIATATEQGLLVPVVHRADKLSLLDTAAEIARVSEAARSGTATRDELTGSTFTITSLGTIGGVLATPILNYPEVGVLGVHAIRKTPIVDDEDNIVIGHMMNLSVSLDHRVVDGFEGASFLQEVKRYLEDPNLLLLAGI